MKFFVFFNMYILYLYKNSIVNNWLSLYQKCDCCYVVLLFYFIVDFWWTGEKWKNESCFYINLFSRISWNPFTHSTSLITSFMVLSAIIISLSSHQERSFIEIIDNNKITTKERRYNIVQQIILSKQRIIVQSSNNEIGL